MNNIEILQSGPYTTVQDFGRVGYAAYGFSAGGVMDCEASSYANILVGNPQNEAVLEMTMLGCTAVIHADCAIAITGADMAPKVNDTPIAMYNAINLRRGDILTCGAAKNGCRAYLAVAGGFDLPLVMGSRSTSTRFSLGGLEGRILRANDSLPLRAPHRLTQSVRIIQPHYEKDITVRVVCGPQDYKFSPKGMETFLSSTYKVTAASDRMGVRLEGAPIEAVGGVDIISDAIFAGSIQIPASGQPIILLADRQTTGGYAKIATVITCDLPRIAQLTPGGTVRFSAIRMEAAQRLYKRFIQTRKCYAKRMGIV